MANMLTQPSFTKAFEELAHKLPEWPRKCALATAGRSRPKQTGATIVKRENYIIKINGEVVATKHAWNSSRREVRALIRALLNTGESCGLTNSAYQRDKFRDIISGVETWTTSSGRTFAAEINRA